MRSTHDLLAVLKSADIVERVSAIEDLGRCSDTSAQVLHALISVMKDSVPVIVASAALALGDLGQSTPQVHKALVLLTRHEDEMVQAAARQSLEILHPEIARSVELRNRTVTITPEITRQIKARLNQDLKKKKKS